MGAAPAGVRNLFRAAMVIFVITIVIGILNGIDVWDVPRNTLLTHVHAGTLGWVTLCVFAGAIWMFGSTDDDSSGRVANFAILAIAIYVLAFWSVDLTTPTSIQRPIGGTLAFIAMVWMFGWAWGRRGSSWNVARFGMILALAFLVFGAILGVLLGLQLSGEVRIVADASTDQLYESHPGAMVAGFVILAGLALIEWLMPGHEVPALSGRGGRAGATQMLLLFFAGVLLVVGFFIGSDQMIQTAGGLQLLGSIVLITRFARHMGPAKWRGDPTNQFVRTAVIGMIIVVALVIYLITQLSGDAEFEDFLGVGLAFDHLNFIMVITNLTFAMMAAAWKVSDRVNRLIYASVNIGVLGFAVGLITEQATLKQIFTPILGLGLLYAIYSYLTAPEATASVEEAAAM